jgi:hypothetical protein
MDALAPSKLLHEGFVVANTTIFASVSAAARQRQLGLVHLVEGRSSDGRVQNLLKGVLVVQRPDAP